MPIVALITAFVLLGAGAGLALYIDRSNEAQKIREATVQARILASTVTAALAFNDRIAAEEYVNAMQTNPEVRQAAIYDAKGDLFVGWSREAPVPPHEQPHEPRIADDLLVVTVPVRQGDVVVGIAYLQSVMEPLSLRIQRYGVIGVLVSMTVLLVSVLGLSQHALSRANDELAEANTNLRSEIAQREEVEAALRQAQKMEAIGQLTGGVAHDFNNLLQVILGNLERLEHRLLDAPVRTVAMPLIESARRGAERAALLTQRLLAFSRRQPLAPKSTDVNQLVSNMSDLLGQTLGEGVQLQCVLAGGLWRALSDENQLEAALLNLAVNARDAMADGGGLTIETANAHLDEAYARAEPDNVAPGQYVMIAVTDTGTGMPAEILEKVFEPFFTTKEIGQGTGLGLSQVYGFVKQSGGHVKIYSEVGRGTTVKLYLPCVSGSEPVPLRTIGSVVAPTARASEQILIVEDQEGVRDFTAGTLRDLGYIVHESADGVSALRALERYSRICLLFTDIGLPGGMNGRQLADRARSLRPDLRVIFTTGYARNAIVHNDRLDAGVELLTKPFTQDELARRIRTALDRPQI